MRTDPNCIFCRIVASEMEKIAVYEDADTLAFMDINPVARGHTLVIPKRHWPDLYAMPPAQLGPVMATARRVATAVREALAPDGVSLVQANGKGAAQSVLHFHMHIVPRTLGDELKINWKLKPGDRDDLQMVAQCLIRGLRGS